MKYILKRDLPLAKAGTEVTLCKWHSDIYSINVELQGTIWMINGSNINEWIKEVKEKTSIYDLEIWDEYWILYAYDNPIVIRKATLQSNFSHNAQFQCFLTEREAKRNKLIRELATRQDKWMPNEWDIYYSYWRTWPADWRWAWDNEDFFRYHAWMVFKTKEEYDKHINEEAKDLLFKP